MMEGGAGRPDLDEELAVVVRRASWLGRNESNGPTVSFTSLWLGFMVGHDPLCLWVQDMARELDLRIERIVTYLATRSSATAGRAAAMLEETRALTVDQLPPAPKSFTPSATNVLRMAGKLASRVSPGRPVAGCHVLAVYLYSPPGHLDTYEEWGLDRRVWGSRLLEYLSDQHPDEAGAWRELYMAQLGLSLNIGIREIQLWASGFGAMLSPPADALDARLILTGVLLDGANNQDTKFSSVWLTRAMGGQPLELLGLTQMPVRTSSGTLRLTGEAQQILARAAAIASATTPNDSLVHVRHLIGAMLTRPLSGGAADLVRRAGVTERGLRDGLFEWLSGWADRTEVQAWRRLLERPDRTKLRLAGYDNDEALGEDRLGVSRDVHALAAVLASDQVKPPLSVGLFGDWGSGKTFFMELLRKRIDDLASASRLARPAGRPSSFCSEVIQIHFNAWQYIDGNLWASLTTHIFDEINRKLTAESKPTVERYAAELASVVERSDELEREKAALRTAAKTLDASLDRHRRDREGRQLSWSEALAFILRGQDEAARDQLDQAAKHLGLDRARLSLEAARAEKQRLQHLGGRVTAWWRTVKACPPKAALAGFFLLLPVALTAASSLMGDISRMVAPWTGALASLVVLAGWVRSRTAPAVAFLDQALDRARQAEEIIRSKLSQEEERLRAERAALAPAEARLERERLSLAERMAAIEAELQALRDGRSFKRFVLERAASDDYRKELGLIASVHRDFKALSERLRDSDEPHVDRIVLYIDDLDRCPPERVVEVLQAVHLILSLPLFVIVVAVDSRWLLRSLEAYYARQFQSADSNWESKPQHYLEKIFQIPFALPPMSERRFGDLVGSLLGKHVPAPAARNRAPRGSVVGTPAGNAVEGNTPGAARPGASASDGVRLHLEQQPATRAASTPLDLAPRNLEIEQAELDFLRTVAPLVRSPRAAKRLVNLYRIIRATLDDDELETFVAGHFKTVQLLLAAVVGHPSLAAPLFDAIFSNQIQSRAAVDEYLDRMQREDASWTAFARLLKDRGELADWDGVREAARAAARYSFETGRILRPSGTADGKARIGKPPRPDAKTPSGKGLSLSS